MLDYLYHAGFTKTYEQLREEAPELVRYIQSMAIDSLY